MSHLPDPYDSTPVIQDVDTDWNYGGINFAILEDRKFKTTLANALTAKVENGFVQDSNYDTTKYQDIDAELLGVRQESVYISGGSENLPSIKSISDRGDLRTLNDSYMSAKSGMDIIYQVHTRR